MTIGDICGHKGVGFTCVLAVDHRGDHESAVLHIGAPMRWTNQERPDPHCSTCTCYQHTGSDAYRVEHGGKMRGKRIGPG